MATITGTSGNDTLVGTVDPDTITGGLGNDSITGGDGNDLIAAGPDTVPGTPLDFNWSLIGGDNSSISNGYVQNTGGINVTVGYAGNGGGNELSVATEATYVGAQPFNPNSSAYLGGDGTAGPISTLSLGFSAVPGSGFQGAVSDVTFRIGDIDESGGSGLDDQIDLFTVYAYNGTTLVPVTFTGNGNDNVTVNPDGSVTVDATSTPDSDTAPTDPAGSILFSIAGPVTSVVIVYENPGAASPVDPQQIYISDVQFNALPLDNDTVDGGIGNDSISGGIGNDLLIGGSGNDTIDGGSGTDSIRGGAGSDSLIGGLGTDTLDYTGSVGAITVNLATNTASGGDATGDTISGFENVIGGSGNDSITGSAGANLLSGGAGNDTLIGGDGDDTLIGGAGADNLQGGTGTDTLDYTGSTGNVTVNIAANTATGGDATGDTITGFENVTGGSGNDSVTGTTGANILSGGAGNDTLNGDSGNDTLIGGLGADSLVGGAGADTADYRTSAAGVSVTINSTTNTGGDAQGDTLTGIENLTGSTFNDTLTGTTAANEISGGEGNDVISGLGGADTLYGGAGADTITGGSAGDSVFGDAGNDSISGLGGNDTIFGGTGADTISGGDGNDSIQGDAGNDSLSGDAGADTLIGGLGSDTLIGGAGADSISGGDGIDTTSYSTSAAGVNVNLTNPGAESGGDAAGDTLVSIENLIGSALNDTLVGGIGENVLSGLGGNDSISGQSGADTLIGGAGADTLIGGVGSDTADYSQSAQAVNVNLATGTGTGGDAQGDTLSSIENLTGSASDDTLIGGLGADSLVGGAGADTADYRTSAAGVSVTINSTTNTGGDAQGDTLTGIENLTGSASDDTLTGNDQANNIDGGLGDDTINSGYGNDSITGGAGNDSIIAGPDAAPVVPPAPTVNLILDWTTTGHPDGTSVEAGFADTLGGAIIANVTYTEDQTSSTATIEDNDEPIYVAGGEPFDQNSSLWLTRGGGPGLTETTIDFQAVGGSGYSNDVTNVSFRISDIDAGNSAGQFIDQVQVYAYDANGNAVPVTITDTSAEITSPGDAGGIANTATATGNSTDANQAEGSIRVDIAGPVSTIVVQYRDINLPGSTQYIYISNVHFTAVAATDDNSDADTVSGGLGDDYIEGGIGADSLSGDEGNDTILGEAGNDTLDGGDGTDSLLGGAGDDSIRGGSGSDTIDGGADNDTIDGGADGDSISGGAGNDSIDGGSGNDTIDGGDGNDTISGGADNDSISGGAGSDSILGGTGNDTVFGGADNDTIFGGTGDDSLDGGFGDDSVIGGIGDDTIFGGQGQDTLEGGDNRDVFIINQDTVDLASVNNTFVDGGEGPLPSQLGGTEDYDTLKLTAWGFALTNIIYDPFNPENGTVEFLDGPGGSVIATLTFVNIERVIPCFTDGTMITTPTGTVVIETLQPGDLVLTRDNGARPIRWIGRCALSESHLRANPRLRPILFRAGSMGAGLPLRDLRVSPQHRMLVQSTDAELLFGEHEVLVAARCFAGRPGIETAGNEAVTYFHILFDEHEIMLADGVWSESFQPGHHVLGDLDAAQREEVLTLFPSLATAPVHTAYPAARITLKPREAALLA